MEEIISVKKIETFTPLPNASKSGLSSYSKKDLDNKFQEMNERLIETVKRLEKVDLILLSVVFILIGMTLSVLIDSSHFNSAVYSEYSQKTTSLEAIQKTNEALLKQVLDLSEQSKQDRLIIKSLLVK